MDKKLEEAVDTINNDCVTVQQVAKGYKAGKGCIVQHIYNMINKREIKVVELFGMKLIPKTELQDNPKLAGVVIE